jgi:hypothetical protein
VLRLGIDLVYTRNINALMNYMSNALE